MLKLVNLSQSVHRESWRLLRNRLSVFTLFLLALSCERLSAQGVAVPGMNCRPVSQRTQEVGCWILADEPLGQLMSSPVFWHLDAYPTRTAAETDKGARATIVESLGKMWLMTIEDEKWRSLHGNRIAEIGPLAVLSGEKYSAQYMEAIFTPGMTAPAHVHSGPEAWYTLRGNLSGDIGWAGPNRPGGPPVIVPMGLSMHLTATGTQQRRALVLILHQSSMPPTTPVHDWTPKGLCKK